MTARCPGCGQEVQVPRRDRLWARWPWGKEAWHLDCLKARAEREGRCTG